MKRKPDFLCVGAAKAGTTTLHDILIQHSDIYLPKFKEAHFFDQDENFSKGVDWYDKNVFGGVKKEKIIGEITPSYLYFNSVPQRIADSVGTDIKLIIMLRHPVDRAWSHYQMHHLRGNEKLTFEDSIKAESQRLTKDPLTVSRFSYMDRGRYTDQIARYLEIFPRENLHFILFENFVKDIPSHIDQVLNFLGVEQEELNDQVKSNPPSAQKSRRLASILYQPSLIKSLVKPLVPSKLIKRTRKKLKVMNEGKEVRNKIDPDLRKELFDQYYKSELADLELKTGLDLSAWNS
ncbi:MAG: hypothetical protein ACI85F_002181 [Bacteroidia bacterium]|jgi:hypothetical protein